MAEIFLFFVGWESVGRQIEEQEKVTPNFKFSLGVAGREQGQRQCCMEGLQIPLHSKWRIGGTSTFTFLKLLHSTPMAGVSSYLSTRASASFSRFFYRVVMSALLPPPLRFGEAETIKCIPGTDWFEGSRIIGRLLGFFQLDLIGFP